MLLQYRLVSVGVGVLRRDQAVLEPDPPEHIFSACVTLLLSRHRFPPL